jgi:hypothetical protein
MVRAAELPAAERERLKKLPPLAPLTTMWRALRLRLAGLDHTETADVLGGDTRVIDVVLKIMARRSSLLGLDAPAKIDVEPKVRRLAAELGVDPDEAITESRRVIRSLPK